MISIEVSSENMKRPEVYEAVIRLIESLNGSSTPLTTLPVKRKASARRASEQVGIPEIDDVVRSAYQGTIRKTKSLFFLSVIKRHGVADSNQIVLEMEKHYPTFTRKSIGGITGAIRRWFDKKGIELPYHAEPDKSRNGIHIFTWVESNAEDEVDAQDLLLRISEKYQTQFQKLISTGRSVKKTSSVLLSIAVLLKK